MPNGTDEESGAAMSEADFLRQLQRTFEKLPNPIDLYLISDKTRDDVFTQTNRQIVRAFRELSDRIHFREYDISHDFARQWEVDSAPTLLISPDRYGIRWLGAPAGEEGRSFLEALLMVGMGESRLSEQSKKVMQRIEDPRNVRVFVSPSCPYCPQQVVNAVKAAVEKPGLISVEIVDIQSRPEMADEYAAHSVPQAFANDILIAQGAQPEEVFVSSLEKMEPQTIFIPESDAERVETDLVIVGGGPAGLTAGIYAERSGLKAAIIEKDALGGQVALTPVVENYTGFKHVGGKTLVDIMVTHALEYCQIYQGEEVVDIRPGNPISVVTTRRKFESRAVLLATGATHKHLGVPGETRFSGRGVSYCATCDGPLFRGKRVIVVGGGNSAATEALHLHHTGVDVAIVHRRDNLRAQEFLQRNLRDNGIPILWNTEVKEIRGKDLVEEVLLLNNRTGEETVYKAQGVFLAIGYVPAVKLAQAVGAAINEDGFVQHDGRHRTNIPGIYTAGDVEGGYKQIVTATGQGAEAAMTIFEDLINPYWHETTDATESGAPVSG
ncbi:MAG: FAD-dependent oxidoreductase [Desulfobacteraceae bacterium]|nr:FAD-dependent oxidoreductase [Desulfobacteraceae bacterium]